MTEQKSQSATAQTSDLDPQSLAAIRDLLASEPEVAPQPVAERVAEKQAAQQAPAAAPAPVVPTPVAKGRKRFASLAKPETPSAKPRKAKAAPRAPSAKTGPISALKSKITGYRPRVKHIVLAGIVLFVLFRPWLVLGLLFLTAFVLAGVFLIMGYDGFWHNAMRAARWYARKRPARAAELHRKLDNFALKFDAFLDRFPEGSVDGLYLPDFGELAAAEARHDAALDRRFDSLRETEPQPQG